MINFPPTETELDTSPLYLQEHSIQYLPCIVIFCCFFFNPRKRKGVTPTVRIVECYRKFERKHGQPTKQTGECIVSMDRSTIDDEN